MTRDTTGLLELDGVSKRFPLRDSVTDRLLGRRAAVHAVSDVSLGVHEGETLALVGESGSGKSTLANLVVGLHEPSEGELRFDGRRLGPVDDRPADVLADVGMVFQNPTASLDPRMTVRDVVAEPMRAQGWSADRRERRTQELLDVVGLSDRFLDRYPHELSGGQAQRVAIMRAVTLDPRLLVLDEPVSALDVSVQAKILNLLLELQADLDLTMLVISHDMGVVEHVADRVAVLYLGRLLEVAPTAQVFDRPSHPYTRALLSAVPSVEPDAREERVALGGDVPSPVDPPDGCRFHTRCPAATAECRSTEPSLVAVDEGWTRCPFTTEAN
ncbi:ABC transporter ATP-binding protein [Halobacteriaceae archaeon GCM10025711]